MFLSRQCLSVQKNARLSSATKVHQILGSRSILVEIGFLKILPNTTPSAEIISVARLESGFQVFKEGMVKKSPKRQIRKQKDTTHPKEKSSKMF
jgi:hypothetical protein